MSSPKVWRSRTSQQICKLTGSNDPREGIRFLVRQLLPSQTKIPTDLEAIAKRLKVESVMEEPLSIDGMLIRENGVLSIKLNSDSNHLRRRFTLAHEIGHIILASQGTHNAKWQRHTCSGLEVERLCDAAASELLMPERKVRDFFARNQISPKIACDFASRFLVSLQSATTRITELKLTNGIFSLMQREEDIYFKMLWPRRIGNLRSSSSLFLPPLKECFTVKGQFRGRIYLDVLRRQVGLQAIRLGSSDFVLVLLNS